MGLLCRKSIQRATSESGQPMPRSKRYVFAAGRDFLAPVFSDPGLTRQLANPMVANENGDFDLCYTIDGQYRVVIESPRGQVLTREENVVVGSILEQGFARGFATPQEIIDDQLLSYESETGRIQVEPGQFVKTALGSFTYQVAPSDAGCPHLTTAGGVHLFCLPTQNGEVTLRQVGGPSEGDITEALQHAIMVASFGNNGDPIAGTVLIDVNEAILSDTIHMHYGCSLSGSNQYRGIRVRGLGKPYAEGEQNMGTRLICTMTDRPGFVIQNGRLSELSGLSLIGAGRSQIRALGSAGLEIRQEATWDAALEDAGVVAGRRYAPHAAIAIDPYSGDEPDVSYPAVIQPSWFSSFEQYGKLGGSSQTVVRDVIVDGWEVGVVQQPGDRSANSDFLLLDRVEFRNMKWGDSTGSSQSRNTTRNNCTYNKVWSLMTNRHHGQRIGTAAGSFNNCSGAGFIGMLFDLNGLSYGGGLAFNEFDVESLWLLGNIENASTGETELHLNLCQLGFAHNTDGVHPGTVLTGSSTGTILLKGCNIQGYDSVIATPNIRNVIHEGTTFNPHSDRTKDYEKLAHNALGGGFVPYLLGIRQQSVRFTPYEIGGNKQSMERLAPSFRHTSRDFCVPIFAGEVTYHNQYLTRHRTSTPLQGYRSRTIGNQFTITSQVERTLTLDLSGEFNNEQTVLQYGYLPGDVVVHEATGTVMFVRSTDDSGSGSNPYSNGTGEVILELQNNYYDNGGTYDLIDPSFLTAGQTWVFVTARQYAPEVPVIGSTNTAAADISVLSLSAGSAANYGLAVGDCLWENQDVLRTFTSTGRAIISDIDDGAGTITMGGNANQAVPLNRFDWWVRQPPANESQR